MVSFFKRKSLIICLCFSLYAIAAKALPASSWLGELLRLGLSFVLPLFFVSVVYFIFFKRKRLHFLLLPFALLLSFTDVWFATAPTPKATGKPQLKVASFNAATLDVKRFAPNPTSPTLVDYTPMFDWVRRNQDVDVLCLQEFYDSFKPGMRRILDSVVDIGGYKYYCINPTFSEKHSGFFGVIIFSKHIPDNCEQFIYGRDKVLNKGIYLDFLSPQNDTLRILNVHLASMSIRFDNDEKVSRWNRTIFWFKSTYERLKEGFKQREAEMKGIERFLDASPENTIVCGDFNATPHMNANVIMRKKFKDAFLKSGFAWGFSYHHFPFLIKIDYQYFSGKINVLKSYIDKSVWFSDHYPLISIFEIPFEVLTKEIEENEGVVVETN